MRICYLTWRMACLFLMLINVSAWDRRVAQWYEAGFNGAKTRAGYGHGTIWKPVRHAARRQLIWCLWLQVWRHNGLDGRVLTGDKLSLSVIDTDNDYYIKLGRVSLWLCCEWFIQAIMPQLRNRPVFWWLEMGKHARDRHCGHLKHQKHRVLKIIFLWMIHFVPSSIDWNAVKADTLKVLFKQTGFKRLRHTFSLTN